MAPVFEDVIAPMPAPFESLIVRGMSGARMISRRVANGYPAAHAGVAQLVERRLPKP
jgi:hypothetical protein